MSGVGLSFLLSSLLVVATLQCCLSFNSFLYARIFCCGGWQECFHDGPKWAIAGEMHQRSPARIRSTALGGSLSVHVVNMCRLCEAPLIVKLGVIWCGNHLRLLAVERWIVSSVMAPAPLLATPSRQSSL
eukprot:3608217-Amphidinium_carterae.2